MNIQIDSNQTHFSPGENISGIASWAGAATEATTVVLRLFWFTRGRGTQDIELVQEARWPAAQGQAPFSWDLPAEPYSFSGRLVSLTWALELVILPEEIAERQEFQYGPGAKEVELTPVESPESEGGKRTWFKNNLRQ